MITFAFPEPRDESTAQPETPLPAVTREAVGAVTLPDVVQPPKLLNRSAPRLPADFHRLLRVPVEVIVAADLDANGSVESVRVLKVAPQEFPFLREATMLGTRRSTFQPALRNGVPERSTILIRYWIQPVQR